MKVIRYTFALILLFTAIAYGAKVLAQRDGILHDQTIVVRHLEV